MTAVAPVAGKQSAMTTVATMATVVRDGCMASVAAVPSVAGAAGAAAVSAMAGRALVRGMAAVSAIAAVPPGVATFATVEPVATMTEEMTCITTIALATRSARGCIEREAVAHEKSCVGNSRSAISEQNVKARRGFRLDARNYLGNSPLSRAPRNLDGEKQGARHGECLVDALLHFTWGGGVRCTGSCNEGRTRECRCAEGSRDVLASRGPHESSLPCITLLGW